MTDPTTDQLADLTSQADNEPADNPDQVADAIRTYTKETSE